MSKPPVRTNTYVSLAVMLLMVVALVAGQESASDYATEKALRIGPIAVLEDRINFDRHFGDHVLKVSIASGKNYFRGEDE